MRGPPRLDLPPGALGLDPQPRHQQPEGWHCPLDAQGSLRDGQVNRRGTTGDGDPTVPWGGRGRDDAGLGRGWG